MLVIALTSVIFSSLMFEETVDHIEFRECIHLLE